MSDPFPKTTSKTKDAPAAEPEAGLRISLSGKTGTGFESGLINISGTVAEVAEFLKLDTSSDTFTRSPFAAIVGTWNAGHHWAQGDYAKKGQEGRGGKAGA